MAAPSQVEVRSAAEKVWMHPHLVWRGRYAWVSAPCEGGDRSGVVWTCAVTVSGVLWGGGWGGGARCCTTADAVASMRSSGTFWGAGCVPWGGGGGGGGAGWCASAGAMAPV